MDAMTATGLWRAIRATRMHTRAHSAIHDIDAQRDIHEQRRCFVRDYTWALPTPRIIAAIKLFAGGEPIWEPCAGKGVWAALLRAHGVTVHATDSEPGATWSDGKAGARTYTHVEQADASEARPANTLLLVWPPYGTGDRVGDRVAARALLAHKGDQLVYVGEGADGCTGDRLFHKLLERRWIRITRAPVPRWPGLYDAAYFYVRKQL